MPTKKKSKTSPLVGGIAAIAIHCDVTRMTVYNWTKMDDWIEPVDEDRLGKIYDLEEAYQWRKNHPLLRPLPNKYPD